jgi:hypothetical protein
MAKEREAFDDRRDEDRSGQAVLASETLRSVASRHHHIRTDKPKSDGGISMFWRLFGGTIFSIVALVVITAYTQMTGTISDLRKDLTQVQADQLKKDDFNNRLTTLWNTIKELQTASSNQAALNEHFKLADQQMDKQAQTRDEERKEFQRNVENRRKAGEDERKDLQRRIDELCQKVQTQAERLAALEGRQSVPASNTGKFNPLLPPRKTKPGTE